MDEYIYEIVEVHSVEDVEQMDFFGGLEYVKVELTTKTVSGEPHELIRYFSKEQWKLTEERGYFRA